MEDLAQRIATNTVWLFVAMVTVLSIWETIAPRQRLTLSTPRRWLSHLALFLSISLPIRLLAIAPVALAVARSRGNHGLIHVRVSWTVSFIATLLIIDGMRYAIHRLCHSVPWLWRTHLLHHSDRDFDFTNDLRFHPLDAALQSSGSLLFIWFFAPLPIAIACSELLTIVCGMLAHANIALPAPIERALRWIVITPGLHRIHHSIDEREQGRNLGIVFSWWDRFFGTFSGVVVNDATMQFGVGEVDAVECLRPMHMVLAPFRSYPAKCDD